MIPQVFISSTIEDLHFLRDAVRDTIKDIGYNPVMSDYGDIGYTAELSVTDACYRAVGECHLGILIISKRYGDPTSNGRSVSHSEFMVMRDKGIPVICLVDKQVLAFKKVHDFNPDAPPKVPGMDHPEETFQLISEFKTSQVNNGYLPFETVNDVRSSLLTQIAHTFGELLKARRDPIKSDIQDILAEVKAIGHQVSNASGGSDYKQFQSAMRQVIDDANKTMFKFLNSIFSGVMDKGIEAIMTSNSVKEIAKKEGYELTVENVRDEMVARIKQSKMPMYFSSIPDQVPDNLKEKYPNQLISFIMIPETQEIFLNDMTYEYLDLLLQKIKAKSIADSK